MNVFLLVAVMNILKLPEGDGLPDGIAACFKPPAEKGEKSNIQLCP